MHFIKKITILFALTSVVFQVDAKEILQKTLPAFTTTGDTNNQALNHRFNLTRNQILNIYSPKKLFIDYTANEVKADTQYKDKLFVLAGKVSKISKNFTDDIYLEFNNTGVNSYQGINANLYPTQICGTLSSATICTATTLASNLKKGELVVLDCIGNGMMLGRPMLKDCLVRMPAKDEPKVNQKAKVK